MKSLQIQILIINLHINFRVVAVFVGWVQMSPILIYTYIFRFKVIIFINLDLLKINLYFMYYNFEYLFKFNLFIILNYHF
jgi:hypothetical protein